MDKKIKPEDIQKITKADWELRYRKGWGGGRDLIFENFLKNYKTKLGQKILDIGSGEGRHIILLAKSGFEVTGIEITKAGNATANRQLRARNLRADLILGDAHNLPFADQFFDSVISIQVFQFNDWKGARLCFSEASRVLKKDGLFFLRVKSTAAEIPKGNILIKDYRGATYKTPGGNIAHFFTKDELVDLGKKYNLKIATTPFDLTCDKKEKGQWNIVFKKI